VSERDDDERQQHRVAGELERVHPYWIVLFGCYSRVFWAFPLFGSAGGYLAAADPSELERQMTAAERGYQNAGRPR
jgi:hypothetical protein